MKLKMINPYRKKPLKVVQGIPLFIRESAYKKNYEKIAHDHLEGEKKRGENPFIEKKLCDEINKKTVKKINQIIKKNWQVLDAGVGNGKILNEINSTRKYGVDVSFKYLCNIPSSIQRACADLENLPYKSEFFDLVVCSDVLEHVFDLNKVIGELKRVLKENGYLIVRVPYQENLKPYLQDKTYQFVHLRNFSKSAARLLFGKIFNFKIINICEIGQLYHICRLKRNYDPKSLSFLGYIKTNKIRAGRIVFNEFLFQLRTCLKILFKLFSTTPINIFFLITFFYNQRSKYLNQQAIYFLEKTSQNCFVVSKNYSNLFKGTEILITLKKVKVYSKTNKK